MTPRIKQLPPDVVAKIAAGEVIERPASVVKELLENSVDAGATRIDLDLEQGGTELIRVVDDGCGMSAEDLPLAVASHATSKLADADDLFRIHTMGFRGEALCSIAGVAKLTIQSRPRGSDTGAEVRCDGSVLSPIRPWGGSVGTRIEVRHLFFNVPVRKKFLKTVGTELGHVTETVTRLALANPTLHVVIRHNNKLVYEIPASATLPDRVALFFGGDVRDALLEVDSGPGPYRVTGYIADPKVDRGHAKQQYLFLNGRWFRDRTVGHALQEGYRGLLMTGRYAVGFLFLTVPPDMVDVNVHPTKAEVRFRDSSTVYSLVRSAVKTRLLKANLVPQLRVPASEQLDPPRVFRDDSPERRPFPVPPPEWEMRSGPTPPPNLFSPRREDAERTPSPWDSPAPLSPGGEGPGVRGNADASTHGGEDFHSLFPPRPGMEVPRVPLTPNPSPPGERATSEDTIQLPPGEGGTSETPEVVEKQQPADFPFPFPALPSGSALQVHDSYIVLETADGMLVIDQHALHERILYEQLRRRVKDGKLEVQRLLIPEPIELPAEQAALVLGAAEELASLGLDVADFGGNTILLSSYPTLLSRKPPADILQGVIDYLVSKDRPPAKEVLLDHLLATMACKAAVKAGDRLSQEEISHLLMLRGMADDSHHCPHGRPTSLLFSRQQLDKQFGRT